MRILLFIDHFGTGGAQRQIVELACGLARHGRDVEVLSYFPHRNFFRSRLQDSGIVVHDYHKGRGFSLGVIRRLAALVRERHIDVLVAYLSSPSVYAEVVKLLAPQVKLVVSERTSHLDDKSVTAAFARRALHVLADHVVANSHAQCRWLKRKWWLSGKTSCIYNGIDTAALRAAPRSLPGPGEPLRLLGVGRIGPEKNLVNLLRALALLDAGDGAACEVSWVGEPDESPAGVRYRREIDAHLESLPGLRQRWHWLGVRSDIPAVLREHHALIHPSLYEGLPNVVCEALASGMPVLISNVCDHPSLVTEGERGFLFDPLAPESMAAAIVRLRGLSEAAWRSFSDNASRYAAETLDTQRMTAEYEKLFVSLLAGRSGVHAVTGADRN